MGFSTNARNVAAIGNAAHYGNRHPHLLQLLTLDAVSAEYTRGIGRAHVSQPNKSIVAFAAAVDPVVTVQLIVVPAADSVNVVRSVA